MKKSEKRNDLEKEVTELLKKVEETFEFPINRDKDGNVTSMSVIDFMADIVKDEEIRKARENEQKLNSFNDKNGITWNYSSSLDYEAIHKLRDLREWFSKYCDEHKRYCLHHGLTEYLKAIKCTDLYYWKS